MDSTLVWALVGGLGVLFLLNRNRTTQNTQKAVAVGVDIFDRIMAGGSRASEKIPAPDVYGCTVASFAANSNIPSTFTVKGEPLAKYKFRQMVHEYLPSEYRNRAYFNCANMEATVFWISYMELFFLESFEALYHPSADWMEKFHEYYWKFAITNMVTTIRQPDIPVFVAKLKDAAFATSYLDDGTIYNFVRWGATLPAELSDGKVFEGYDTDVRHAKIKQILSSSVCREFRENAVPQAKNLVSLFVPENAANPFDIDDEDKKLPVVVDNIWVELAGKISIPPLDK